MEEDDIQPPPNDQPRVPKPMQHPRPVAGAGPSLIGTRQRREPPPPIFCTQTWEDVTEDTEFDNDSSSTVSFSMA